VTQEIAALWSNNLRDADKVLQAFFDGCVAAGPEGCAFYAPTSEEISQNLTTLYESIRARPIPVRTPSRYGLVDFDLTRTLVFAVLYSPRELFVPLANILAALARGDGSPLFDLWDLFDVPAFECSCDPAEHQFDAVLDSQLAIICNDGRAVPSGFDEAEQHYKNMVKASSFGSRWAYLRIQCSCVVGVHDWFCRESDKALVGGRTFPNGTFKVTGWFSSQELVAELAEYIGPVAGNTSVPLLIIGNTAGTEAPDGAPLIC
jgi:hypothetical protein